MVVLVPLLVALFTWAGYVPPATPHLVVSPTVSHVLAKGITAPPAAPVGWTLHHAEVFTLGGSL